MLKISLMLKVFLRTLTNFSCLFIVFAVLLQEEMFLHSQNHIGTLPLQPTRKKLRKLRVSYYFFLVLFVYFVLDSC
jgi:hypothetical protein